MYYIEFHLTSLEEGTIYNDFLKTELGYHRLPNNGPVAEKRKKLYDF